MDAVYMQKPALCASVGVFGPSGTHGVLGSLERENGGTKPLDGHGQTFAVYRHD